MDYVLPVFAGVIAQALGGAVHYFTESSGHSAMLGDIHKYTKLLWICLTILIGGNLMFWFGGLLNRDKVS